MDMELSKKEAQVYLERGNEYQNQKELEQAKECYQQAVAIFPEYTRAWRKLAEVYEAQAKLDQALNCYQSIVQYNQGHHVAYSQIAKLREKQGNMAQVIATWQAAINKQPERPVWFYIQYGDALDKNKQSEAAIETYKKAIELDSDNSIGYRKIGHKLMQENKIAQAVEYFEQAFALSDEQPVWIYAAYARSLNRHGSLDKAMDICQLGIKKNPSNANLYCILANLLVQKNAINAAISNYKKAIRLEPKFVLAYQQLGDVFKKVNHLDYAVKCYQRALEINPQAKHIYRLLGDILVAVGCDHEAQVCYARAS